MVRFLRQEKEVATVELRLAQHELARLRSDVAIAQRAVLEANAQVCCHSVAPWNPAAPWTCGILLCVFLPSRPSACHSKGVSCAEACLTSLYSACNMSLWSSLSCLHRCQMVASALAAVCNASGGRRQMHFSGMLCVVIARAVQRQPLSWPALAEGFEFSHMSAHSCLSLLLQLGAEAERSRRGAKAEQEHAALMEKVDQLNLLRESNATLRCVSRLPGGPTCKTKSLTMLPRNAAAPWDDARMFCSKLYNLRSAGGTQMQFCPSHITAAGSQGGEAAAAGAAARAAGQG